MVENMTTPQVDAGTVLVVDDDRTCREVMTGLLEGQGHRVVTAADGQEALAQAARGAPDVVLLDAAMPGMDGIDVCRQLKANALTAHIPVLMVTGTTDRKTRLAAMEAGADDWLGKPVDIEETLLRVRNAIRSKRRFDQVQETCRQLREMQELRDNITSMIQEDTQVIEALMNEAHARREGPGRSAHPAAGSSTGS